MQLEYQVASRSARQSRPQLVCVLADNSGSMRGAKAQAATEGIREMVWECQSKGPRGPERSYFQLVLIQFGCRAELVYDAMPVRQIDADTIEVRGNGGGTNITEALELTYQGLVPYMGNLQSHPERAEHPLPLVLLFSDGHNGHGKPEPVAPVAEDGGVPVAGRRPQASATFPLVPARLSMTKPGPSFWPSARS